MGFTGRFAFQKGEYGWNVKTSVCHQQPKVLWKALRISSDELVSRQWCDLLQQAPGGHGVGGALGVATMEIVMILTSFHFDS